MRRRVLLFFLMGFVGMAIMGYAEGDTTQYISEESATNDIPEENGVRISEGELFKIVDSDGNGVVTKEESKAYVSREFKNADMNKDGNIMKDEYRTWQMKIFNNMDKDGDGVVTGDEQKAYSGGAENRKEYKIAVLNMDEKGEWFVHQYVKGGLWKKADANGDDSVTVEEWLDAADGKLKDIDVNGDDAVTLDEFMSFISGSDGKTVPEDKV